MKREYWSFDEGLTLVTVNHIVFILTSTEYFHKLVQLMICPSIVTLLTICEAHYVWSISLPKKPTFHNATRWFKKDIVTIIWMIFALFWRAGFEGFQWYFALFWRVYFSGFQWYFALFWRVYFQVFLHRSGRERESGRC